jgi:crossover junction endodeoxyribonuclease RusA
MLVSIDLPYPVGCTGNTAVRHAGGRHYLSAKAVAYHALVAVAVRRLGLSSPLVGPLRASWVMCPPDLRARDHTNVFKVCEDALTRAGFWVDDSNRVIASGDWRWAFPPIKGGRISLTVSGD